MSGQLYRWPQGQPISEKTAPCMYSPAEGYVPRAWWNKYRLWHISTQPLCRFHSHLHWRFFLSCLLIPCGCEYSAMPHPTAFLRNHERLHTTRKLASDLSIIQQPSLSTFACHSPHTQKRGYIHSEVCWLEKIAFGRGKWFHFTSDESVGSLA